MRGRFPKLLALYFIDEKGILMKNRLLVLLLVLALAACTAPTALPQVIQSTPTQEVSLEADSFDVPAPTDEVRAPTVPPQPPTSVAPTSPVQPTGASSRRSKSIAGMYIGRGDNPTQISLFEQSGAA